MIKVLVVVWGLVLFVPDAPEPAGSEELSALWLNTQAWPHMPAHAPSLRQFGADMEAPTIDHDFRVSFRAPGSEATELSGVSHLIALADLMDDEGASVRRDCLDARSSCALAGQPMVLGTARFEGSWASRPASRCKEFELPLGFRDQALWNFRTPSDPVPIFESGRRYATALVLETEVEVLDDLVLEIEVDGVLHHVELTESPADVCEDFSGAEGRCVVIEMANGVVEPTEWLCRGTSDDPAECRVDSHFVAFYDLLVTPPAQNLRLIPVVTTNYSQCNSGVGIGHDPSPRCPPPVALP